MSVAEKLEAMLTVREAVEMEVLAMRFNTFAERLKEGRLTRQGMRGFLQSEIDDPVSQLDLDCAKITLEWLNR